MHDTRLNPIDANVTMDMKVLTYQDFSPTQTGFYLYLANLAERELMSWAGHSAERREHHFPERFRDDRPPAQPLSGADRACRPRQAGPHTHAPRSAASSPKSGADAETDAMDAVPISPAPSSRCANTFKPQFHATVDPGRGSDRQYRREAARRPAALLDAARGEQCSDPATLCAVPGRQIIVPAVLSARPPTLRSAPGAALRHSRRAHRTRPTTARKAQ